MGSMAAQNAGLSMKSLVAGSGVPLATVMFLPLEVFDGLFITFPGLTLKLTPGVLSNDFG